jgi:peptidoglycan/xylan/chitin deacetylase (PgdA/CDA1 family)
MKKLLLAAIFLAACNKGHFAWISNNPSPVIQKAELRTDIGGVRLTFDDGPSLSNTPKVLALLKKYNLQATFFVEGINLAGNSEQAQERRELLKQTSAQGHIIGNHTFDHKALTSLSEQKIMWEIDTTTKLIEDTTGKKVELIRLPYGKSNSKVSRILKSRNLTSINWAIDLREWERDHTTHTYKTKEQLMAEFNKQYDQLKNTQGQKKMILLLHDTKNVTIEALPLILERLNVEKQAINNGSLE